MGYVNSSIIVNQMPIYLLHRPTPTLVTTVHHPDPRSNHAPASMIEIYRRLPKRPHSASTGCFKSSAFRTSTGKFLSLSATKPGSMIRLARLAISGAESGVLNLPNLLE